MIVDGYWLDESWMTELRERQAPRSGARPAGGPNPGVRGRRVGRDRLLTCSG